MLDKAKVKQVCGPDVIRRGKARKVRKKPKEGIRKNVREEEDSIAC